MVPSVDRWFETSTESSKKGVYDQEMPQSQTADQHMAS